MPEAAVIGLLVAPPALAALARRWATLLVPVVAWPLYFVGLARDWWCCGLGDGWQLGAAVLLAVGVVSTTLAFGIARLARPPRNSRRAGGVFNRWWTSRRRHSRPT